MSFEFALRLTEILLAVAICQQSAEHLNRPSAERPLFAVRLILALALLAGVLAELVVPALLGVGIVLLRRFDGPYNGGSDKMTMLILFCLTAVHLLPSRAGQELAFGYLSLQLVLSYVVSGWVKIRNPDWRSGQALTDVFRFSAYPVSEALRLRADQRETIRVASWTVMLFEIGFPLFLLTQTSLFLGLSLAAAFHLANACLFGLNRFFWIWIAAYPSVVWLQDRLFS